MCDNLSSYTYKYSLKTLQETLDRKESTYYYIIKVFEIK